MKRKMEMAQPYISFSQQVPKYTVYIQKGKCWGWLKYHLAWLLLGLHTYSYLFGKVRWWEEWASLMLPTKIIWICLMSSQRFMEVNFTSMNLCAWQILHVKHSSVKLELFEPWWAWHLIKPDELVQCIRLLGSFHDPTFSLDMPNTDRSNNAQLHNDVLKFIRVRTIWHTHLAIWKS